MSFIRFILYSVFFYFVYKIVLGIIRIIFPKQPREKSEVKSKTDKGKLNIKKEDIIEADFEELKSRNSENKN